MITYIDTSVLVKLVIEEPGSDQAAQLWDRTDRVAAARIIVVEAHAALAAAARGGRLGAETHETAKADLAQVLGGLAMVEVTKHLVLRAAALAEQEALRGYDAVHLASALWLGAAVMASTDAELCRASQRVGLHVANPLV